MSDVFDHPWLGGLFGDAEAAEIWSPDRQIAHMLRVEAAWSRALGATGRIAPETADAAARAIEGWHPDPELLRAGTAQDGLPVPALSRALKSAAGEYADAVHTGLTSQDVMDTALVMTCREMTPLLDTRLSRMIARLDDVLDRWGDTVITGRTRMQDALPMAAGQRIGSWRHPLPRHRTRLAELRPRIERIQMGGAVGDRQSLGDDGPALVRALAERLDLDAAPAWHAARDGVIEYGACLALIAGSCGKIGQDAALMAQSGDIAIAGGGGSSAMPHKQNPVLAELLVTLARYAAGLSGLLQQSAIHEQERSGAAWALEWMTLPLLAQTAARSLSAGETLLGRIDRIGPAEG